jgi:ribonuclease HI
LRKGCGSSSFDGSICNRGRGIGCFIVIPKGVEYEMSTRLEFRCTNNQAEYEALLTGLEMLVEIEVKNVEAFGDSELVVQQMKGESQYLSAELNEYRVKCLGLVTSFKTFNINIV